ncbi:hypothetical protein RFM68_32345 [Mesorhizobium sp. MSK_1335]|uniref:Uncharacterized protein n=1 Tax=Mesorhizobium montanum TaxID=3072323 RepID=A0ABU4ZUV0_9HYPH|nr:hypothetical protein [Mesorhizobium sp. MSK_1335]MDX8529145.1 hypothetical protein [Mesorhizobium sp. MSK_1335]
MNVSQRAVGQAEDGSGGCCKVLKTVLKLDKVMPATMRASHPRFGAVAVGQPMMASRRTARGPWGAMKTPLIQPASAANSSISEGRTVAHGDDVENSGDEDEGDCRPGAANL